MSISEALQLIYYRHGPATETKTLCNQSFREFSINLFAVAAILYVESLCARSVDTFRFSRSPENVPTSHTMPVLAVP